MDRETAERLIVLLKKDRKRVIQILTNLLKDFDGRITVPNELLEELFIKKTKKVVNKKDETISEFIVDPNVLKLYKYFDFGKFTYKNLYINIDKDKNNTLNIMRDNDIIFYTDNIINKRATGCKFKDIFVSGNFNDWNIENADFTGCLGFPKINPSKTSNKSIANVQLADTIVLGDCDNVDITGASFENATIFKGFVINPQKVKGKNLSRTKLKGVEIVGSFDKSIIDTTDFTGCTTDLVLNLDKINYGKKKKLSYNKFSGITIEGNLVEFELSNNDFTGSINAVMDFDKSSYVQISSKWNNFSDVTFKNMYKADQSFLYMNNNKFDNACILYNSFNKSSETCWYSRAIDDTETRKAIEKITMINEDEEIEKEIKSIIGPEIIKQKVKKMESN